MPAPWGRNDCILQRSKWALREVMRFFHGYTPLSGEPGLQIEVLQPLSPNIFHVPPLKSTLWE